MWARGCVARPYARHAVCQAGPAGHERARALVLDVTTGPGFVSAHVALAWIAGGGSVARHALPRRLHPRGDVLSTVVSIAYQLGLLRNECWAVCMFRLVVNTGGVLMCGGVASARLGGGYVPRRDSGCRRSGSRWTGLSESCGFGKSAAARDGRACAGCLRRRLIGCGSVRVIAHLPPKRRCQNCVVTECSCSRSVIRRTGLAAAGGCCHPPVSCITRPTT